jgi:hypothetical protein
MELIHLHCERDIFKSNSLRTNHSLENLASKQKTFSGFLKNDTMR